MAARMRCLAGHLLPCPVAGSSKAPLADRVAIVTGSSSGVGAAVVEMLAEKGCSVVVNFSRSEEAAQAVAKKLRGRGARVLLSQADVGSDEGCEKLVQDTIAEFGRIDFLVNNAGTTKFVDHANLDALATADFQKIYDVNAIGAFRMTKLCAPHMRKAGGGRVVNVSSIAGAYHTIGSCIPYIMSKAALTALTAVMAKVLGPDIVVNAVCPGFIEGDWLREGMTPPIYDFVKNGLEHGNPMRAVSSPENVASAIVMLLEASSTHITGQAIVCDGGFGLLRGPLPS